jgi:hypothetical protein
MKMLERFRFFHVGLVALIGAAALAACSSGGCGNCTVPPFNATGAGVIPTPTPTPLPPGVTPSPSPTPSRPPPTATPTPSPSPSPTLAPLSCNQRATPLGAALAPFAVLAGSTVTNVGNTYVTYAAGAVTGSIHDDLIGVFPGTAITGFPPGVDADGPNAIYGAGFNTNTGPPSAAQAALTTAYTTISGTAPTVVLTGTPDLSTTSSGLSNCGATGTLTCPAGTFGAGVFRAATTASIATANLTLDGGGNPLSVFIFEIGTSLTTVLNGVAGGNVLLINNASACNIYWTEGAAATINGATFNGNILTGPVDTGTESITIGATTFNGRALAKTAVTISAPVTITNPGGN